MELEASLKEWTPEQRQLVFPNTVGGVTRYGAFHELVWRPLLRESPATAPESTSVLPMNIKVGDRFTDAGFEWEVRTHPTAMHGAKALRARVVRPGLPETEREVTWLAHERVTIRRGTRSAP